MSSGALPDLRMSTPEVFARYKEIVLDGELKENGMASFADHLKEEDVKNIRAYVVTLANVAYAAQPKPAEPAPAPPQ
jgi:mono/diheme cytochrome c family protein